ncbi:SulP family inorganic anion transporter [Brumimicrobium aurantiacum]|uniref:SulP family inorganic anion transporter n=2 Tax=Brumimicrobium aurantiacum TaxID=1737063 RepID=A0A3E1F219_9FLAO|nr:SulP family inorganic anion transporter [Brumimicrobium aurantiacum]
MAFLCPKKLFMKSSDLFKNLKYDIPSGLVVFLVALPLCLGIALASGAPMFSGIIAGVVGGIVVGAISGSSLGVSGPAAGLAVIVADSILELGTNAAGEFDMAVGFQAFLVAGVIAGVLQIILAVLRAGIIGYYFPSSVIKGMLAGIGITLILKQIPHAFGMDKNPEGNWKYFEMDNSGFFSDILYSFSHFSLGAIIITIISLTILILFQRPAFKEHKILKIIPGPLLAVVVAVLTNELFVVAAPNLALTNEFIMMGEQQVANSHLVDIQAADSNLPYYGLLTFPDWTILSNPRIYLIGATLAIVASLETLLSVAATDKLDPYKRTTPTNRELLAQGSGNVVSSLIGGLPITQVIVRSSTNISSGGRTKMAGISHGIFLMVFVLALPSILNKIPLAVLAAVLFVVGYKLANISLFKELYKQGMSQFLPFIVTIVIIVGVNLLWGIIIGFAIAVFYIIKRNYENGMHSKYMKKEDVQTIQLGEVVSFFNKGNLHKTFDEIKDDSNVVIDGSLNKHMDYDIYDLLEDFYHNSKSRNINVKFVGFYNRENLSENSFLKTT